jgi:hypothetical protein
MGQGGVEVQHHTLWTSTLDVRELPPLCSSCFVTKESAPVPKEQKAGWVSRVSLDALKKINALLLPEINPQFLGHPTHSLVITLTELSWLQYSKCITKNSSFLIIHQQMYNFLYLYSYFVLKTMKTPTSFNPWGIVIRESVHHVHVCICWWIITN